jgi:hypothetical protein
MTMRFGRNLYQTNDNWGAGGAVEYESADGGQLTLDNDLITENSATNGSGGAVAAFNDSVSTLTSPRSLTTISNSTVSDNTDVAASGGTGGGIFAASPEPMVITDSIISGNQSLPGLDCTHPCSDAGGILEFSGNFVAGSTPSSITNSVVSDNQAQFDGAGLDTLRPMTISGTVFSNNLLTDAGVQGSGAIGGGAGLYAVSSPGTTSVTGSTFTANNAGAGAGGGVANGDGTLDVTDSRIVGNSAARGGGLDQEADPSSVNVTNATEDWWGCNAGPNSAGCDTATNANTTAGSSFTTSPWVVLKTTASPTTLLGGGLGSSTLTASFLQDSAGHTLTTGQISELVGLSVAWSATHATVAPITGTIGANGSAASTLTSDASCAAATGHATVDNVPPADAQATASLTVTCPNLTSSATDDVSGSVSIGGSWNWTIKVANSGDAPATFANGQTIVSDDLPDSNITYATPTGTAGSGATGTISCAISAADTLTCTASGPVTIGTGGTLSVVFKATPSTGGTFANPRSGGTCVADPANVIAEHSETDNACSDTVNVVAADLTAVKTNNVSGTDLLGSSWTWQIHVANPGAGPATFAGGETILTDDLPGAPTYGTPSVSGTAGTSGTGTIACSLTGAGSDTLTCTASGGTVVLASGTGAFNVSLSATPPATGAFVNPRSGGLCAVDPENGVAESNETNNQCADTVQVVAPDLSAATNDDVGGATTLGNAWVWTTTITNNGTGSATFASGQTVLSDDLSAGVSYDAPSAADQSGSTGTVSCAIASNTLTCTASGGSVTLPAAGAIVVTTTAHPGTTGTFSNPRGGGACAADPDDHVRESNDANNACTADSVTVTAPDLSATNSDDTGQATIVGGSWTWKVHITNGGSAPATFATGATVLSDDLPNGPTYGPPASTDAGMQCTIASGTMTCKAAGGPLTIPTGGSIDATFSVAPAAVGTFSNPATSGTCAVDPGAVITESDESNNACTADAVTVSDVDLTVANTDDADGAATLGNSWTWRLHIANAGATDATFAGGDAVLTDALPSGPAYSDVTSSDPGLACAVTSGALSCTPSGASLTIGAGTSIDVTVKATPAAVGTFTNPRSGGECSVDPGNVVPESDEHDNACGPDAMVVTAPDLTAIATDDVNGTTVLGNSWTWKIHVTNAGDDTASFTSGVALLTDSLPTGSVTYGSPAVSGASGLRGSGSVACTLSSGDLSCTAAGGSVTLPPGAGFDVLVTATPSAPGAFANPRQSGSCSVDPGDVIIETSEANNACRDSVTVAPAPPAGGAGNGNGNGDSGNGNGNGSNAGGRGNDTCVPNPKHKGLSGTGAAGKARFRISALRVSCRGVVDFRISVPRPGQISVLVTSSQHLEVPHATRASGAAQLQPALGRFAFARAQVKVGKAGAVQITIKPNSRGRDLVAHHRLPVRIRTWVVFTPTGGKTSKHGFIGLLVIR